MVRRRSEKIETHQINFHAANPTPQPLSLLSPLSFLSVTLAHPRSRVVLTKTNTTPLGLSAVVAAASHAAGRGHPKNSAMRWRGYEDKTKTLDPRLRMSRMTEGEMSRITGKGKRHPHPTPLPEGEGVQDKDPGSPIGVGEDNREGGARRVRQTPLTTAPMTSILVSCAVCHRPLWRPRHISQRPKAFYPTSSGSRLSPW